MTRRQLLKILLFSNLAPSFISAFDHEANAAVLKPLCSGQLSFRNIHTDEMMKVQYLNKRGKFDRSALGKLNHLFRCHFCNQVHPISPELFLLLDAVRSRLSVHHRPYLLISGYRSRRYNNFLLDHGHNVAKNSYHIQGMAADVRIEGVSLADIHRVACQLKVGGVGSYPDFIHIDVGPVRYW